jgi:hypothetical protein
VDKFINQKQIKEIFEEFGKKDEIELNKKNDSKDFLKFLAIDIRDWIKENLRYYFREKD